MIERPFASLQTSAPSVSSGPSVPSLLDRLTDTNPDMPNDQAPSATEPAKPTGAALRRDLEMLLNTRCRPTTPPEELEELENSLLTLGVEDFFSANLVTDHQRQLFVVALRSRIARFEPRLEDLSITVLPDASPRQRNLRLRIEAQYRARPGLPPIVLETRVDPVAGHFSVLEGGGRG